MNILGIAHACVYEHYMLWQLCNLLLVQLFNLSWGPNLMQHGQSKKKDSLHLVMLVGGWTVA